MKKLFALCFLFAACQKPQVSHQRFVDEYFGHFNAHHWKAMAAMYADTATFRDPSLGIEIVKQTPQQIVQKYTELSTVFPNIKDSVTAVYNVDSNNVVVEFTSTGTGPDGQSFSLPICSILTLKNGKIIKDYTYYDNQ